MILCVDDEELGLKIRRLVLESEGYHVLTATNGPDGLEIYLQYPIDAVVLDYFMPEMNGREVAEAMRRLRPEVPILLLSAYVNLPSEVTKVVDCTIMKGAGPNVLLAKLRESLAPPNQKGVPEGRS